MSSQARKPASPPAKQHKRAKASPSKRWARRDFTSVEFDLMDGGQITRG